MGNSVYCHGHEYWSYGGHEEYEEYFPTILLTYTEEEVKKYVDNLLTLAKQIGNIYHSCKKLSLIKGSNFYFKGEK